ncbi:hypothetical protein AZZ62_002246, partial [Klebsiella variicola]
ARRRAGPASTAEPPHPPASWRRKPPATRSPVARPSPGGHRLSRPRR